MSAIFIGSANGKVGQHKSTFNTNITTEIEQLFSAVCHC